MNESWDIVVDWLARHSPPELALIRPPAAEDDIRDAERSLGTALPDDLVAWWRRADGQTGKGSLLPPFYSPYPVRAALRSREVWMTAWNGVMEQESADEFAAYVAQEDHAPASSPCEGAWLPHCADLHRERRNAAQPVRHDALRVTEVWPGVVRWRSGRR